MSVFFHLISRRCQIFITGTGEHGVGLSKKKYLVQELGEGTVALLCMIKRTLDPNNLFNPGKVSDSAPSMVMRDLSLLVSSSILLRMMVFSGT